MSCTQQFYHYLGLLFEADAMTGAGAGESLRNDTCRHWTQEFTVRETEMI